MEQEILYDILPALIFFVVFSIAFSLLELIVMLLLNQLEKRHWEWMIDVIIRSEVHHGKIIKYAVLFALWALVIILIVCTPIVNILTMASREFRLFALILALVMLLFNLINIRKNVTIDIEKKISGVVFFIISLTLYFFIIIAAQKSYEGYGEYINQHFTKPAVKGVETVMGEREKTNLLNNARHQYLANGCTTVDYTKEEKDILIKNILLLASEPDLAFGDKTVNLDDPEESLKGMACSDGKNTLLLTENGSWYFVNEEYIKFIK